MRILRLKLANLASLVGEHEISFEAQPLQHAGLIAITGKTGAGKSTLLDAICLALYHKIPRLKNAKGNISDVSGDNLKIEDSKHILTRSLAQGFSEVEFYALDQKRYRATWTVSRAYKKIDGKLKVEYGLTCLDEQKVIASSANTVREHIPRLVGMNFEQFTRAVLLAQSEVGAFLKADANERADLLEYLTNSDIFRLISQLSFEKTRDVKQALDLKKDHYGHIPLLTQQEIEEIDQQIQQLSRELAAQQQQLHNFNDMAQWYSHSDKLHHDVQHHHQQLTGLIEQQADIAQQKTLLEQLEKFAEIRPTFEHIKHTEHKIQQTTQQLALTQQQLQQSAQQHSVIAIQQHEQQQQCKAFKTRLHALQPDLQRAIGYDHERLRIGQDYTQKKQAIQLQQQQLNQLSHDLQQLTEQLTRESAQQQHTEQQLSHTDAISNLAVEPNASLEKITQFERHAAQLMTLTADYADFSIAQFREQQHALAEKIADHQQRYGDSATLQQQLREQRLQLQQLDTALQAIHTNIRQVNQQHDLQQNFDKLQHDIAQLHSAAQRLQHECEGAEAGHQRVAQHAEQVKAILEQQRLLNTKPIQLLREKLLPEQPCMVCGSIEHPFIDHAEQLEQALQQVQKQQIIAAETDVQVALERVEQIKQQLTSNKTLLNHHQQTAEQIAAQIQPAQQQLIAALQSLAERYNVTLNLTLAADVDTQHLTTLIQDLEDIAQLKQQHVSQLQQDLSALEQAEQQHLTLHHAQQQQQQIASQLERYHHAEAAITTQLNQQWQQAWQQQPLTTAQQLKQHILQRVELQQQLLTHQQTLQRLQQQEQQLHVQLEWQHQQLNQQQQQLAQIEQNGKANNAALSELFTQHQVSFKTGQAWHDDLQHTAQQLEQQLEHIDQAFKEIDQTFQQHKLAHTEQHSQLNVLQQDLHHDLLQQQQWLSQHPEFDPDVLQSCLQYNHQTLADLRQRIQKFEQHFTKISSTLALLQQQYDTHHQQVPEVEREQLQALRTALDTQIHSTFDQRSQYQAQLLTNTQNQHKQAAFQAEIEQAERELYRWKRISDLIGSSDGAKFQRIAQAHHLDILLEYANLQLQPLSTRYQLTRIPNSLALAVIDLHMDAVIRPVQSLSGGETFLVALALALAIANLAAGSLKLDTLFIDEGFGTLDPDSLHIVMDALDKLQSQGRKVILISHIQELHERIPVKIMVQQLGNGRSKIEVVGY